MPILSKTYHLLKAGIILSVLASCHHFYMPVSEKSPSELRAATTIDSLNHINRYFILRNGNVAYYMRNIALSPDQKTVACTLDTVSAFNQLHLVRGKKGNFKYAKSNVYQSAVLNEVHLYIQPDNHAAIGKYTLDLQKVQKIEVIEKDRGRTTASYILGAIGYTLGAIVVVGIIIAATKSSCPFVSAYDHNAFVLQGEIYGGAIYPQMARHDYIPLTMSPTPDGSLQLKISNELKERQYTDMAELLVVTHDTNSRIYSDEKGNLYNITKPESPIAATLSNHKNVLSAISKAGDNEVLYLDDSTQTDARNDVLLYFHKPANVHKGKLVLSLKNSYWLDYLYGELARGFGTYYTNYIQQQHRKPLSALLQWTKDQQLPLAVAVNSGGRWKQQTDITTIGPVANRTVAVPVDLPDNDTVTAIRLSSGFMFWEIDYAAIDYSATQPFTLQKISPSSATDEIGRNVLPALQKEDGIYLEQPQIGNAVTLVYRVSINLDPSKAQTYMLHAKGYYEHIRDFKNKPDISFLQQFSKPNAFPLYGIRLYNQIRSKDLQTLAKNN